MSNIHHDLDEQESESFGFKIGGIEYVMRYPTTEEIEKQGKMTDKEAGEYMLTFIDPVNDGDPQITDTLKKVTLKKVQYFKQMIGAEFN